jgi:hypothetical protein
MFKYVLPRHRLPCQNSHQKPRAYKNLSRKTRAGVGIAVIAWGGAGLYLSERAEERFGLTPSEKDMEELRRYKPQITTVDKSESP